MKSESTGIIMASGEGSRMRYLCRMTGLPKHLLPIGDTTIVTRIARELSTICNEVICIIPPGMGDHFEKEFHNRQLSVDIIAKNKKGFTGDFYIAFENASHNHIILTIGDLIFPDGEIKAFIKKSQQYNDKLVLAFDKERLKVPKFPSIVDFRMVLASLTRKMLQEIIDLNPESLTSVLNKIIKYIIKKKIKIILADVLFNINTPHDYFKAKSYFKNGNQF